MSPLPPLISRRRPSCQKPPEHEEIRPVHGKRVHAFDPGCGNAVIMRNLVASYHDDGAEGSAACAYLVSCEGGPINETEWVLEGEVLLTESIEGRPTSHHEPPSALVTSLQDLRRGGMYIPSHNRWQRVWRVERSGLYLRLLEDVPQEGGQMTLWPGALVLAKLIEGQDLRGKTVVELGAGCGLVSMVAHARGAPLTLATEQSSSLPYLTDNLHLNNHLATGHHSLRAHELSWGDDAHINHLLSQTTSATSPSHNTVDMVLGCEITYDASLYPLLIHTLRRLLLSRRHHTTTTLPPPPQHDDGGRGQYPAIAAAEAATTTPSSPPPRALLVHNHESTPASARSLASFLQLLRREADLEVTVKDMAMVGSLPIEFVIPSMLLIEVRERRRRLSPVV